MRVHEMQVKHVPVDHLLQHPDNPNNGDVGAISESIEVNGLYQPVLVQSSTGHIVAGNHRYLAALALGAQTIPAIFLEITDIEAKRIMLADNRTARLGVDDEGLVRHLLDELYATDPGIHGTGYEMVDYDAMVAASEIPLDLSEIVESVPKEPDGESAKVRLNLSVIPVVDEDGTVHEFTLARPDYKPLTVSDIQAVREAFGLEKLAKAEIEAFDVPDWGGRRRDR